MKSKKSLMIFSVFAIALAIAGVFVYAQTQSEMQNELNLNTLNKVYMYPKGGLLC